MTIANLCIALCSLAFYIFLVGIYFSKKNMDNIENKIYKQLLFWNLGILVGELIQLILAKEFHHSVFVAQALNASYYIPGNIWIFFLSYYIIIISCEKNEKIMNIFRNKKTSIGIMIFLFTISIIQIFLPTNIIEKSNEFVAIGLGPSYIFANGIDILFILVGIIVILINRKHLDKKKIFPFKILVVLGIIIEVVSFNIPLTLAPIFMTLTSYLMYHTIENPDVQLITELTLAKDTAEKANHAKSDFLSSMSHELRTPLNAIVGLSQMIEVNDNVEEMHTDSRDIIVASQKLLELVDGILEINNLDNNEVELIEEEYNTNELFNSLIDKMNLRIGDKDIKLVTNYSSDLPNILIGDSNKIKTIINNLLTNAIKYTDSGMIKFDVNCMVNKDTCNLIFTVSDTGRGIADDRINDLFTKFNRLDSDKDSDIEGTGLGLAITKSLVELMNGKISVNSVLGEGSTFTVNLTQKVKDKVTEEIL